MPPQVIVITGIGDAPILDNDRAVSPAAELTEFRGVDQKPADAEQLAIFFHGMAL